MSETAYELLPTVPTHTGESQPPGAFFFTAPVEEIGELKSAYTSSIGNGLRSSSRGRVLGVICGLIVSALIKYVSSPDTETWWAFAVLGVLGWLVGAWFDRESHDKVSYIGSDGFMLVKRDGELIDPPRVVPFDRVEDVRWSRWYSHQSSQLRCRLSDDQGRSLVENDYEELLGSDSTPGFAKAIIESLAERNLQIAQQRLQESGETRFSLFGSDVGEKRGEIRVTRNGLSWTENSNDTLDTPWGKIKFFSEIDGSLILKAHAGDRTAEIFDVANMLSLTRLVSDLRQGV